MFTLIYSEGLTHTFCLFVCVCVCVCVCVSLTMALLHLNVPVFPQRWRVLLLKVAVQSLMPLHRATDKKPTC